MFKELTLQNIWESDMPLENGSTFKFKSTLWWPVLVDGLSDMHVTCITVFSQIPGTLIPGNLKKNGVTANDSNSRQFFVFLKIFDNSNNFNKF